LAGGDGVRILDLSERFEHILMCPVCNYPAGEPIWTHQVAYVAYERGEDGPSMPTVIGDVRGDWPNPSPRRDGLRVLLTCEWGEEAPDEHQFWLCVVQHKGNTFLWTEPAAVTE
jgi:hypothetical protein